MSKKSHIKDNISDLLLGVGIPLVLLAGCVGYLIWSTFYKDVTLLKKTESTAQQEQTREEVKTSGIELPALPDSQTQGSTQVDKPKTPSTPTSSGYRAPVCTTTVIPAGADTVYSQYMYIDERDIIEGKNGYDEVCTADSTGWTPTPTHRDPINAKIYIGTKERPNTSQDQINNCVAYMKRVSPNSTAYMQCY